MVWCTLYDRDENEEFHQAPARQLIAANANSYLDHHCELDINSAPAFTRLTGIISTIGPATTEVPVLEKLMEAGVNIIRVKSSLAKRETMVQEIENIREAAENYSKRLGIVFPVGIALDLKGSEIHTGYIEGGLTAEVELKKGELIKLTIDRAYFEKCSANIVYVDYSSIHKVMKIGNRIYIDDGLISLICTNIQGSNVCCIVENGGMLGSCKGVNLPGVDVDLPDVSEQDKEDLLFGLEMGIDIVFASFVKGACTISTIRDVLGQKGSKIMVVAKIETQQAIQNLDEIIKTADGVMVGRGDLGIEIPVRKLFLAQKNIIAKCNKAGIPVICANQMLESMTRKLRPTRAESTDVANAILDGADCVMLSNETIKGEYPLESVLTMAKICKEAEAAVWYKQYFNEIVSKVTPPLDASHTIAIAAVEVAFKCLAAAIIVVTTSGKSAFLISKYRPNCPILAITRSEQTARQAHMYRGILPLVYNSERMDDWTKDVENRLSYAISFGKWKGFIKYGDPVIAVNGSRRGTGHTDTLRLLYVTKPTVEGEICGCPV